MSLSADVESAMEQDKTSTMTSLVSIVRTASEILTPRPRRERQTKINRSFSSLNFF